MNLARRQLAAITSIFLAATLPAAESVKPAADSSAGVAQLLKASGLTQAQFLGGVKSGLGTAIEYATKELTNPGAFQLSGPSSMAKLQAALVRANQTGALDAFKASLNQAASTVAPQSASFLKESLKGLSMNNASGLGSGAMDSATKMLRQVAEPALRTKLMPMVKEAIAANGSAAKIKELAAKAGPMAAMLGVPGAADLENYLLTQVVDTSFGYIAKQEASFRANPSLLKDASAAKVFSLGKK